MTTKFIIDPPLLNSSSPWATSYEDLRALYTNPYIGAITTRTSLIDGFNDTPTHHQHCFFTAGRSPQPGSGTSVSNPDPNLITLHDQNTSSLNTYGYSPIKLNTYLEYIKQLTTDSNLSTIKSKPIIISITGSPSDIIQSHNLIYDLAKANPKLTLAVEINLSCPNIAGKPPPSYDQTALRDYLDAIKTAKLGLQLNLGGDIKVFTGLKLPPYTYAGQFNMVVDSIRQNTVEGRSVVDFLTSTNTLGSCLLLDDQSAPVLKSESGTGIGGMAGAGIHTLSLGNVATLRKLLDEHDATRKMLVIGVGGVMDSAGFERMRSVGAHAVGVATALGRGGIGVFERIAKG